MLEVIKYDSYQTEEKMVVGVMIKNAEQLNCKVTIEQDRLLLEADGYSKLELHLCEPINVEKSFHKFGSVKVEVTLIKLVGRHWADLTKEKSETKPTVVNIYKKDWDGIAKSIEDEKAEDDAFFQNLYASADAESRRAIEKSFSESNGTVLSTNWKEVSAKKTETMPPDGTEFIPWNDEKKIV